MEEISSPIKTMQSVRNWLSYWNPFSYSPQATLDHYVAHPEEVYDAYIDRWLAGNIIYNFDRLIKALPNPNEYLLSLPGIRRESNPVFDYWLYIRNKATSNAQLNDPVGYDNAQKMLRFLRERRLKRRPLTREEQAEFDHLWSFLPPDRLRDLALSMFILPGRMSLHDLYGVYYDYINHLEHLMYDNRPHESIRIPFAFDDPYYYWLNDRTHMDINKFLIGTSQDELRDYLVTLPNVDLEDLPSMNKRDLIRYFDTLMIDAYNKKRDEYLQTLRDDMNAGQKSEDLWLILSQLSIDDLVSILDEYSIEHHPNVTHDEAVDLIKSYFDLFLPPEQRSARLPLSLRKQP